MNFLKWLCRNDITAIVLMVLIFLVIMHILVVLDNNPAFIAPLIDLVGDFL